LLRGQRRVANLLRVAEQRGGDRAAEIDIDAAPFSVAVRLREAGKARVYAALDEALLDSPRRCSRGALGAEREPEAPRRQNNFTDHGRVPSFPSTLP
jgi:hypothetical protein